jgi:molecular chaperone DnaJ
MSEKRDFYEVLLVERTVGEDEIRKAYKKLALKYHPDRNQGDQDAERMFKEATEAYTILSDADKRAQYDRFGHGMAGGGFDFDGAGIGDIFSHFQDMFSHFFGGMGGGGGRGPARGQDTRVRAGITFREAMEGLKKEIIVSGPAPCESCDGSGAKAGTKPTACVNCAGTGQSTTQRGFIMFSTTCPRCRGAGKVIAEPCESCRGQRYVEKRRTVLVTFPAGIDSGQRLRVTGQGMPGASGAEPGDLYVDVEVEGHPDFERDGFDMGTRRKVSFAEAALGGKAEVTLPNDAKVEVEWPGGTQPGTVLTVRGKGLPRLDRRGQGDLHVLIEVEIPRKLSRKARKLVEELRAELGD